MRSHTKNLKKDIETYVESKRELWSAATLRNATYTLHALSSDFDNPLANYHRLLKEGKGKYTIQVYFTVAANFEFETYGKSAYKGFLKRNATAFKNCYKDKTRDLKEAELNKFLSFYLQNNPGMYNLLILMGHAGLRISEALNAKFEDIRDGLIWVIGKGDKQRSVPFDVTKLLNVKETGSIVATVAYRYFFKKDMAPFTPHDFRAYFATFVSNHPNLNIKDARLLLGHSSVSTTERYVRSDMNRIKGVLVTNDQR